MCSTREATVRDVAARDFTRSLSAQLESSHIIRTPNKMKADKDLRDRYFQEAGDILRLYYMNPSATPPVIFMKVSRTKMDKDERLTLSIRQCAFDELMRVGWLYYDSSNLILVTEKAKAEMDRLAQWMLKQKQKEIEKTSIE